MNTAVSYQSSLEKKSDAWVTPLKRSLPTEQQASGLSSGGAAFSPAVTVTGIGHLARSDSLVFEGIPELDSPFAG
jgi:hypothetical protein